MTLVCDTVQILYERNRSDISPVVLTKKTTTNSNSNNSSVDNQGYTQGISNLNTSDLYTTVTRSTKEPNIQPNISLKSESTGKRPPMQIPSVKNINLMEENHYEIPNKSNDVFEVMPGTKIQKNTSLVCIFAYNLLVLHVDEYYVFNV